jgi:hypothetical protein
MERKKILKMRNFKKKSKYGSVKVGGYDSRKEAKRAAELKLMQEQGIISELKEQVKYELIPKQVETIEVPTKSGFKKKEVCLERACTYTADFVYQKDGQTIVEDVKGMRLEVYKIKKKLMLSVFGIKITEK